MQQLNKFRSLVPLRADQREVRCKSVAIIITVIEVSLISRNTHQAQAKVMRDFAQTFLDMKSVAVLVKHEALFS